MISNGFPFGRSGSMALGVPGRELVVMFLTTGASDAVLWAVVVLSQLDFCLIPTFATSWPLRELYRQ